MDWVTKRLGLSSKPSIPSGFSTPTKSPSVVEAEFTDSRLKGVYKNTIHQYLQQNHGDEVVSLTLGAHQASHETIDWYQGYF